MPEYLAPGVYVEETSFRAKSIEGVGTSTTAFVGLTRKGPLAVAEGEPLELLTNFGDFTRIYGGIDNLELGQTEVLNHVAHAVLNYFAEGGSRLYVARVAEGAGTARSQPLLGTETDPQVILRARFPGRFGNLRVIFREIVTPVVTKQLKKAPLGTLVRVSETGTGGAVTRTLYELTAGGVWHGSGTSNLTLPTDENVAPGTGADLITVAVVIEEQGAEPVVYDDLGFAAEHPRSLRSVLALRPNRRADALVNPIALEIDEEMSSTEVLQALFGTGTADQEKGRTATHVLSQGTDGGVPTNAGVPTTAGSYAAALSQLLAQEDVSIVAAPGHTSFPNAYRSIQSALLVHVETPRAYRIAVLDTPPDLTSSQARLERARIDSSRAALYYPWVVVANPLARPGHENVAREIALPPSGFVCGIYARNDVANSVAKAPANEVVRGALRFESDVNFANNQLLNPLGVNCLRYFPGRGYRVWGARTASSDPEWKYVNVRRYFNYLEASIDRGTQWAVFENNGERLWANIRATIDSFLYNEWVTGNLLGASPKEAYFVRCDRSTMTQNDLDNGRLVCLIGVAALKPAEFVIFRIGQKTADSRS
jgi:phage tail sheath protein FI